MKAAVRSKYGTAEVLSIKEIETPTPTDHEVLIKVYATTVNRSDWHILTGKPLLMRLFMGLFKPKLSITGTAGYLPNIILLEDHTTEWMLI